MATITINGTLVNDQTTGLQDGDDAIDNKLAGLNAAFQSFLTTGLPTGVTALSSAQLDFADNVEAAISDGTFIKVDPQGSKVSDLFFSDAAGKALDGDQVLIDHDNDPNTAKVALKTVSGQDIYLWSFGDYALATTGKDPLAKGEVVAAFYLNEASDKLTAGIETVTFMPIAHPDATNPDDQINWTDLLNVSAATSIDFGFAGAPSGSNLFMTFGNPSSTQIVVIGQDPLNQSEGGKINTHDVLNISQAGSTTSFGVNGNAINPDEGAYITYVTGTNTNYLVPNLNQNEADIEANIDFKAVFDTTGAGFTVNQTNPGVGPVTVRITAYDTDAEPGKDFVDGLTDDGDNIDITSFSIVNFVVKGETAPLGSITDGVLTITGLSTGDKVLWTTGDTHNRVLIENVSNADDVIGNDNNTFDIGGFSLTQGGRVTTSVGDKLFVDDDGPTAPTFGTNTIDVVHDETPGVQNGGLGDLDGDDVLGTATAYDAKTVASLFSGLTGTGDDPDVTDNPIGYARSGSALVTPTGGSAGTDGEASTVYSLKVSAAGADSGVSTTEGTQIFLYQQGGLIVGRVGTEAGAVDKADSAGTIAFAVAINPTSGEVFTTQYLSLKHPTFPNDYDEPVSLTDGAVQVTVTITDKDGDKASASDNVGSQIVFEDDGPTAPTFGTNTIDVVHDETPGVQNGGLGDLDGDDVLGTATAYDAKTVASLFSGLTGGDDPDVTDNPIGFARSGSALVTPTGGSAGADGEASTVYSLKVSAAGADSGVSTTGGTQIFLYQQGDLIVGRVGTEAGAVDKADSAGTIAFAVAINPTSGEVFTTQYLSLKHPTFPNDYDEPVSLTDGAVQVTVTITDKDGDKASASDNVGSQIVFEDDGPTAPTFGTNTIDVVHDETPGVQNGGLGDLDGDDVLGTKIAFGTTTVADLFSGLTGGDDPDVTDNPIGFARSGSALVTPTGGSAGADGEASTVYSLKVSSTGADSGVSTTGGTQIFLYNENNLVVGRVGTEAGAVDKADPAGTIAFAVAIDPTSGEVFTTQYLSLKHPTFPNDDDEPVSLTDGAVQVTVTITDKDGDKASASDNVGSQIVFEDDGPVDYDPQNQSLLNLAGASISGDLDTGGKAGSDGFGSVVFTGFTDGDLAKDKNGAQLKSGGENIELNGAGTGVLTGYVDANNDNIVDKGETVFTINLDATTDTYLFTLVKDIDDGSSSVALDFDDVVGGNDQWFFFNSNAGPTNDQDVLFTSAKQTNADGKDQTANTSATDIGVSNQWIGDSAVPTEEGVRIDFVNNITGNASKIETALNDENGFLFSNRFTVNNAGFTINQTKGGGITDIKVRLSNASLDQKVANSTYAAFEAQSEIAIVGIVVTNGTTTKVEGVDYIVTGPVGGFVTISGLDAQDHVKLTGATDYERIEVNYASGDAFAINEVTYDQGTAGNPLDLQFKTLMADGDGDTSSGLIDVNLQPTDNSADTFTGYVLGENLFGGGGNDTVSGGDGNDTINGGSGSDALSGGKGSDTYIYQAFADGKDTISDFDKAAPGSGGDTLDVSAVLDIAGNTWSDSGSVGEAITDEYITFTLVDGFVQVNVDIDGKAEANFTPTAMAVLTGVTAATDLNDNIVVG